MILTLERWVYIEDYRGTTIGVTTLRLMGLSSYLKLGL